MTDDEIPGQLTFDDAAARLSRWFDTHVVLNDVIAERESQHEQWGDQVLPMGTGGYTFQYMRDYYRTECQAAHANGTLTYQHILLEEVFEALAESDPLKLKDELIQAGAVIVKMIELINREQEADGAAAP